MHWNEFTEHGHPPFAWPLGRNKLPPYANEGTSPTFVIISETPPCAYDVLAFSRNVDSLHYNAAHQDSSVRYHAGMADRFFVDGEMFVDGGTAAGVRELTGPQAHHLIHVMRAAVGDSVVLFDGSGGEYPAVVEAVRRREVTLSVGTRVDADRELPFSLTMAVALPKGDRQKWLVEKLTELGVTRLIPLVTRRGVAQPSESACDRLRRNVIESCKQCGRNRLMEIGAPAEATEWFASPDESGGLRFIAHPSAAASPLSARTHNTRNDTSTFVAIGPEGGFTAAEVDAATSHSWQPITLGERILRVETAAVATASFFALSHQGTGHE